MNILRMVHYKEDASLWTIEDMLNDALSEVGIEGKLIHTAKKAIILCLDETDGNYNTTFYQSGMKTSEIVALLEVTKQAFLQSLAGTIDD